MNHYLNAANCMCAASGLASAIVPNADEHHRPALLLITEQVVNCHDALQVAFGIKAPSEALLEDLNIARLDGQSNMDASQLLDEFVSIQLERAISSLLWLSIYYFEVNTEVSGYVANAVEEMRTWLLSAQKAVDRLAPHMPDGGHASLAA